MFPPEYRNTLLVARKGSWNREQKFVPTWWPSMKQFAAIRAGPRHDHGGFALRAEGRDLPDLAHLLASFRK